MKIFLDEKFLERRKLLGLSRRQIADIIGCSQNHIYYLETGRSGASPEVYVAIAKVLGMDTDCPCCGQKVKP